MYKIANCANPECGEPYTRTGPAQRWCNKCSRIKKIESKKRSEEIHYGGHKCKTCDKIIPIEKIYCGYVTKPNSCAAKAAIVEKLSANKKPVMQERKSYRRDTSCDGSGYF